MEENEENGENKSMPDVIHSKIVPHREDEWQDVLTLTIKFL